MTSKFQLVNLDKIDVNFSEVWNKITVQQLFHWLPVLLWRTLELFLSFNTHIKQICRTFYYHQQVMADGCPSSSLVLQEVCSWVFPSHYPEVFAQRGPFDWLQIHCLCYFEVGQSSERKLIFILASLHWLPVIEFKIFFSHMKSWSDLIIS